MIPPRLFTGVMLFAACTLAAAAEPRTASSILQQVADIYAAISTYQDSGVVLTHDPSKEEPDAIIFRTLFVRPDQLRFDWTRHHPYPPLRHMTRSASIRPDDRGSHFMATGTGAPQRRTLNEACGGAAGVSRGSSVNIPRLLTPTLVGFKLVDLTEVKWLGDEIFEGVHCHRIEGLNPGRTAYEIFVGVGDSLIRRILIRFTSSGISEEIHRDIRINDEIPRVQLIGDR